MTDGVPFDEDTSVTPLNPYRAPESATHVPTAGEHPLSLPRYGVALLSWIVVFALNCVVPLKFGRSVAREDGPVGIALSVLVLVIAGAIGCARLPWLM